MLLFVLVRFKLLQLDKTKHVYDIIDIKARSRYKIIALSLMLVVANANTKIAH